MSSSGASFWSQHGARERQQLVLISNCDVVTANNRFHQRNVFILISATAWEGRGSPSNSALLSGANLAQVTDLPTANLPLVQEKQTQPVFHRLLP